MQKVTLRNIPGIHAKDARLAEALRDAESELGKHANTIDAQNAKIASASDQVAALQKTVSDLSKKVVSGSGGTGGSGGSGSYDPLGSAAVVQTNLNTEVSRATAAEATLQTSINTVSAAVTAETTRAESAEASISGSIPVAATTTPLVEYGTGAVGTSAKYAREDHVHPAIETTGGFTQLQSDWTQSNDTQADYIKNKPTLGTAAAHSASDFDATGAAAAVQANLNTEVARAQAAEAAITASIPSSLLPASVTPLVDSGSGAIGTSPRYAREDHVHPASEGSAFNPSNAVHFYEEFVGGTNTSGYIGETGWRLNGGGGSIFKSLVTEVPANSYCGLIQLQSQTGWVYLFFGQDNAQQYIAAATGTFSMKCRVAIVGTSTGQVRIGFFIQDGVQNPSDGVYFEQTNSGNCRAVTRKSSTETSTDTGVALSLNQWATLEIVGVAGTITFKINGNVVATQSTNVPTSFLTWGFECAYVGSVQAYLDIDYAMLDIAISR